MDEMPEPAEQLRMMGRLWKLAMTSPALYMAIGLAVGRWVFEPRGINGFWPLEAPTYRWVILVTVAVVMAMALAVLLMTMSRPAPRAETLGPYRYRVYATLIMGDAVAGWGLILYLIQGDAVAQGMLCLAAWGLYAIGRPAAELEPADDRAD